MMLALRNFVAQQPPFTSWDKLVFIRHEFKEDRQEFQDEDDHSRIQISIFNYSWGIQSSSWVGVSSYRRSFKEFKVEYKLAELLESIQSWR